MGFKVFQCFSRVFKGFKSYKGFQGVSRLFKAFQGFSSVFKGFQVCSIVLLEHSFGCPITKGPPTKVQHNTGTKGVDRNHKSADPSLSNGRLGTM